jgi:hypothetical protein
MSEATMRLRALRDPTLPALPALVGEEAASLVQAFLGETARVRGVRASGITWRPGRSASVLLDASLVEGGRRTRATIVLATGGRLPAGAAILESGPTEAATSGAADDPTAEPLRVAAWRVPDDPWLPGLAVALDPAGADTLLRSVGLASPSERPRLRAYRPGRRAVVELRAGRSRVFVKVVRPTGIERLQRLHQALTADLPVPRSQGWSPQLGLVVLGSLPGVTLREALRSGRAIPSVAEHAAMLGRIAGAVELAAIGGPTRSPVDDVAAHAELLTSLLPEDAAEVRALGAAIGLEAERWDAPTTPVHGDYYEAQLLTVDRRLTGLLDIDTAGIGRPADDEATLLGHLAVLADGHPQARRAIVSHAEAALRLFERQTDPTELRRRAAAVILGLATGPFRVQSTAWPRETRQRITLAGRWLESADRAARTVGSMALGPAAGLRETGLTSGPSPSHLPTRP